MSSEAADILAFWFAPETKPRWFKPDPAFDATLKERFAAQVERAGSGALDAWRANADGALALVLLLDQMPRNIWRGTPRAFAFDGRAREIADHALAMGFDRDAPVDRRLFLYLPFEHSEALADQERSVRLFEALGDPDYLDYAVRHRDVIARFGRFPHRNTILGRPSTAEELAFLAEPGSSF
jgi:uncharacterized protein (DUF924 family)